MLVEPAGPLNVGSVARLCRNFGLEELRLVAPRCDHLGEEARRMAVKGLPLLQKAMVFPRLADALADCGRVVATSGRPEGEPLPLQDPDEALSWLLAGDQALPAALVFGREDRGLSNDELLQAGRLLQIPTPTPHGSLNLSHAVAVVLHDLHRLGRQASPGRPAQERQASCGAGPLPPGGAGGHAGGCRSAAAGGGLPAAPHGPCPDGEAAGAAAARSDQCPGGGPAARHGVPVALGEPPAFPFPSGPLASGHRVPA